MDYTYWLFWIWPFASILLICSTSRAAIQLQNDHSLGHYAFDIASGPEMQPPKVRKPPYIPANVPCAGIYSPSHLIHPKDTLCGDLNKGYVPLNPLNHLIDNQPYPFELIKNKTLSFLAKSLPFLQQDLHNIPKVFRMPIHGMINSIRNKRAADPGLSKLEAIDIEPSVRRSGGSSRLRTLGRVLQALDTARSMDTSGSSDTSNDTQTVTNNHTGSVTLDKKAKGTEPNDADKSNLTDSKNKGCDSSDGILCQVMQLVASSNAPPNNNALSSASSSSSSSSSTSGTSGSSGALLNTIAQTLQVMNSANSLSGIAQALAGSGDGNKSDHNHKPLLAQVIQAIGSLSSVSNVGGQSTSSASTSGTAYNPLGAILDFFTTTSGAASHLLPARRKKPLELEDLLSSFTSGSSERTAAASSNTATTITEPVQLGQNPPTACPSVEEYVAPVYARNYQGIWKYVVQIPHEGYFTQTVQKTSCVKGKCDYMDGFCKESSRWVSLLVAEVYYPEAKFAPIRQPTISSGSRGPSSANAHKQLMSTMNAINNPITSNSFISPSIASAPIGSASISQPFANNGHTSGLQALASANSLASLSTFHNSNPTMKYAYSSLANALPADYNHYDGIFSRRTSNPNMFTNGLSGNSGKQAKLATTLKQKLSNFASSSSSSPASSSSSSLSPSGSSLSTLSTQSTSSPSSSSLSSVWSGYTPQQINQMWQQYHQAFGLAQNLKPSVRSVNDHHSTSGLFAPLFSASVSNNNNNAGTFTNRWFGSSATARSSDARPRSLDHSMISAASGGYMGEDEPVTMLPKSNDVRSSGNSASASISSDLNLSASSIQPSSDAHSDMSAAPAASTTTANNNINNNNNNNNNNNPSTGSGNANENGDEECDGYDSNGCYVIRVYYDWFLVPGSCKCWKRSSTGSFDTLKRIFIG